MSTSLQAASQPHLAGSRGRRGRPRRDFQAMEERRMRAADLFEQGVRPAEIARQVGVCHQIVSDWRAVWRRSGRDGLRAAGRAGRLPKVGPEQLAQVEIALVKGAEANGYPTDLWTLQRVAEVIERVTGSPITQHGCGTSCARDCTGPGSDRHVERQNATTRPLRAGSSSSGHAYKKGQAPERADRV